MNKKNLIKILCGMLTLLILSACHQFMVKGWLAGFGYDADECEKRDWTHHSNYYPNGTLPGRTNMSARKYRCRIERICVGKSEAENKKCKIDAGNYWEFSGGNKLYSIMKESDDAYDAICALNRNPWDPNFKGCSPKFCPQENYDTNPYYDKKTKTYILPNKIEK